MHLRNQTISTVVVALVLTLVLAGRANSAEGIAGYLRCNVASGWGFVFGVGEKRFFNEIGHESAGHDSNDREQEDDQKERVTAVSSVTGTGFPDLSHLPMCVKGVSMGWRRRPGVLGLLVVILFRRGAGPERGSARNTLRAHQEPPFYGKVCRVRQFLPPGTCCGERRSSRL